MSKKLAVIDDTFFTTAPLILNATIELPQSPEEVWAAVEGDKMGSWIPVLDKAVWQSPRPLTQGAIRTLRIARFITIREEYYNWDVQHRATFRTTDISVPVVSGWAEDILLEPLPTGGTSLTWTMALDSKLLRILRIPRVFMPAVTAGCQKLMRGIQTILPPKTALEENRQKS